MNEIFDEMIEWNFMIDDFLKKSIVSVLISRIEINSELKNNFSFQVILFNYFLVCFERRN